MPRPEAMKGFAELATVSGVLRMLYDLLPGPTHEAEDCDLVEALQRVLAEDVVCPFDAPPFDRSAVDGYALAAAETIGASPTNPLELKVVRKIPAGRDLDGKGELGKGECALVFTGAPLPAGTDSVVMVEHCTQEAGTVQVRRQVHRGQNVSRRGEDYSRGETMLTAGSVLKPWHLAAAASVGVASLRVRPSLRLGVVSTGSEIVEPGRKLAPGQVANSTKPLLLALARQRGCRPVDLGTVPDGVDEIRRAVGTGLQECDIVLTTGGSSVGESDLVSEAISDFRSAVPVAHGLRIRPGRPTGVSVIGGKPVFILSGFPVAAMAGFQALVEPTISHMTGSAEEPAPTIRGVMTRRVSNESGNRSYVRVRVSRGAKGFEVDPLIITGSGLISTLTKANGMLVIDEAVEGYDEGEQVEVLLTGKVSRSPPSEAESDLPGRRPRSGSKPAPTKPQAGR